MPARPLLGFAAVLASGGSSGPRKYPVRGEVRHRGAAAAGALVVLHPKADGLRVRRPYARVDDAGRFAVATAGQPGALPGEYALTVVWLDPPPSAADPRIFGRPLGGVTDRLGKRFADPTSPVRTLTVTDAPVDVVPVDLD